MLRVETNLLINRPPEEVWHFFEKPENGPVWLYGLKEMKKITEGPNNVGTRFAFDYFLYGREMKQVLEIVKFEPYKIVALKLIEGGEGLYTYIFEPVANGTNFFAHAEVTPDPLNELPEPVYLSVFRRYFRATLENLKDFVEVAALVPA